MTRERTARRKAQRAQAKMNRKLDERLAEDMPPCSFMGIGSCTNLSTHLIVTLDSLIVYGASRDRKDILLWGGCNLHQEIIAKAVKSQGYDVQVMTARALAHLGEVAAVPSDYKGPSSEVAPSQ